MSKVVPAISLRSILPSMSLRAQIRRGAIPLATEISLALSPLGRLRGLLGRPALQAGQGMLLRPCKSIHTCFMGYPIDALFMDEEGVICGMCLSMHPWRFSAYFHKALCVLELRGGTLDGDSMALGDVVEFYPTQ